jgi:hypothetical protein
MQTEALLMWQYQLDVRVSTVGNVPFPVTMFSSFRTAETAVYGRLIALPVPIPHMTK